MTIQRAIPAGKPGLISDQQGAEKRTTERQHADPGSHPMVVKPLVSGICPVGRRTARSPLYNFIIQGHFPPCGHDDHR